MEKYSIALAKEKDLPIINKIYETARNFMKANGNKTQWKDNYPESDLIKEDIESKRLFVRNEATSWFSNSLISKS